MDIHQHVYHKQQVAKQVFRERFGNCKLSTHQQSEASQANELRQNYRARGVGDSSSFLSIDMASRQEALFQDRYEVLCSQNQTNRPKKTIGKRESIASVLLKDKIIYKSLCL